MSSKYLCEDCNRTWPRTLGRPEEKARELCPECGSEDVRVLKVGLGGFRHCTDDGTWPAGHMGRGRHRRGRGGPGRRRWPT